MDCGGEAVLVGRGGWRWIEARHRMVLGLRPPLRPPSIRAKKRRFSHKLLCLLLGWANKLDLPLLFSHSLLSSPPSLSLPLPFLFLYSLLKVSQQPLNSNKHPRG